MIDVILVLLLASYALSGYRQGFVVGVLSLTGFVGGAVLAMSVVPLLSSVLGSGTRRSISVIALVLVLAWGGQVLGAMLGAVLRDKVPVKSVRLVDHALGAFAGIIAVSLVAWFVGGALRASPTPALARTVAASRLLSAIDAVMPAQLTNAADGFREAVADSGFPRVFAGLGPEQILPVQAPDPTAMSTKTLAAVRRSIVKITGNAVSCSRGQEGSGAVVAAERVVTNAHVVAGVRRPYVQVGGTGHRYRATVVLFDARRDVAVLKVPGLPAPALSVGDDLGRGDDAVIAGFPQNGPFAAGAARVRSVLQATGDDIYGRSGARREVYSLYATVQPGNSGGPVLDTRGEIVGLVFAKSLDDAQTGYALTLDEIRSDLETGVRASTSVSTGACSTG